MAAILTSEPRSAPVRSGPAPAPGRPRLVVLEGGRSAPPASASAATLRWRRLVAASAAVLLAAVAVVGVRAGLATVISPAAASGPSATGEGAGSGPTMTVETGDTLWSIARELRPTGEVRPLVDELVAANGSRPLRPGQEIEVPAGR